MWYIEFDKNNRKRVKEYSKKYKRTAQTSLRDSRKKALSDLKFMRRAINVVAGLVVIGTIAYVIF